MFKSFEKILDGVTYYYLARLDELSPQQKKIIDAVAKLENKAKPKQISESSGVKISAVTPQLKRLKDLNILTIDGEGKRKYYSISEYLFYLWYAMRYLEKRKHIHLVKFLELWYGKNELIGIVPKYFEAISQYASSGEYKLSYNYAVGLSY